MAAPEFDEDLEDRLLAFFQRMLEKNAARNDQWAFTLPSLYEMMGEEDTGFKALSYSRFRQWLYKSSINQRLQELGGVVEIQENRQQVDHSLYVLKKVKSLS